MYSGREDRKQYKNQQNTLKIRYDRARKFKIDYENLDASLTMVEFQIERNLIPTVLKKRCEVKAKILLAIKERDGR